jgi:hypothetical protein
MIRARGLRSVVPVGATLAVLVAVGAGPAQARVASSQTIVSVEDTLVMYLSSTDGCVESSLFLTVGQAVSRPGGQPVTGGQIFYTRYNECTGQYLAGINQLFEIESGGLSVNGDLRYGAAQFTTSATDQVTHEAFAISVDVTFTGNADLFHDHHQEIFYIDGVGYAAQDSEWYRPGEITGTFSVGGVGGTTTGDGSMSRGRSTIVIQTFGPPFP